MKHPLLLAALFVCVACSASGCKKDSETGLPKGDDSLCLDVNRVPLTDGMGVPIKAGTDNCKWLLNNLGRETPCRTAEGHVIYDELNRAFPEGKYCAEARVQLKRQAAAAARKKK
ncbi:hypothetical protein LJC46_08895 [Desulfovibrio sp. OttesenSCG-928-G15]|nr:hypothetical protein [Desulfovibrio sp. OttesenSCG-928-G15]